jgi:hypothetical protein
MRKCIHCQNRLGPDDLLAKETRRMEVARVSMGLEGIVFRYYSCPRCGHDLVYLEMFPLPGESQQDLDVRRESLTLTVLEVRRSRTSIIVAEQSII